VRDEILSVTLTEPPVELGITHWSSRLLADRLRRDGKQVSHSTEAGDTGDRDRVPDRHEGQHGRS
jgi:hypothetical protein